MAASHTAGDVDGSAPGTALAAYTELLETLCAGGPGIAPRCAADLLAEPRLPRCATNMWRNCTASRIGGVRRAALARHLEEYGKTRGAVSELASSLLALATGYAALSKAAPPPAPTLRRHGRRHDHRPASRHHQLPGWVRPVGACCARSFPSRPRRELVKATTGAMLAAIGVVTALAWIVLDPLLATTGIRSAGSTASSPWARSCVEAAAARIGP